MRTLMSALVWGGAILVVGGIVCCRYSLTSAFTGVIATGSGILAIMLAGVLALLTMLLLLRLDWGSLLFVLIGCVPPAAALAMVGVEGFKKPLIHDITTDTRTPPEFEYARIGRAKTDNSLNYQGTKVAELQRTAYPDVLPVYVNAAPLELLPRVEEAASSLGWKLMGSDELTLRVEAQERSSLFGFVDDVVIRIAEYEAGSRVDIRSVSRFGKGDLGANAARIQRFYKSLCGTFIGDLDASCTVIAATDQKAPVRQKSIDSIPADS